MATADAHLAVQAVWHIEAGRLVAGLARMLRDVGLAEDLAQDALVAALESWPKAGIPDNPGAWLMATAKRRAVDQLRKRKLTEAKRAEIAREIEETAAPSDEGESLLGLMFAACHPAVAEEARVALTLRTVGGLTTEEIARAFLVPAPTVAQRIVRAKRMLEKANVPFALPEGIERTARLPAVFQVLYFVFNEGYTATVGETWARPDLCEEALRLGRMLAELAPQEPEVHGLVALMELQASRLAARIGPSGVPVLLLDQDRRRWDQLLIRRGLTALAHAEALGGATGVYALQAAIAACHARAVAAEDTDWKHIAALYAVLAQVAPSPVVELNRAVAVGMVEGPTAGLAVADRLLGEAALAGSHLLASVRADLLAKLGRREDAAAELRRAAGLTQNEKERELLRARVAKLESD